jgi:tetratricopeptide (TPR) repeat protein
MTMPSAGKLTFVILAAIAATSGCSEAPNQPVRTTAPLVEPNRHHIGSPLTEQESSRFATDLLDAVRDGDVRRAQSLMDWDAVWDTAFVGIELSPNRKSGIVDGFKDTMNSKIANNEFGGPLGNLYRTVAQGAVFHLLKLRTIDSEQRALYRLATTAEGAVKYYEITLARRPGGRIMGTDLYVFQEGERLSDRLRRLILSHVGTESRSLLERLQPRDSDLAAYAEQLEQMVVSSRTGNFQRTLDIIRSLPSTLQREKFILLMRIGVAQHDEKEYEAAIDEFRRYFPNDPSTHFVLYNWHLLHGEFEKAIECVDRMDEAADGDAYLNVLRAAVYLEQKDMTAARRTARLAADAEGTTVHPYTMLITVSLNENEHDETLKLLQLTHEKFGIEFNDLRAEPDFARFIASPQYEKWMRYCQERRSLNQRTKPK